ncbi:MAG: hypothetical protein KC549_15735 [Myxococcales bacterium]|nr:hypothetical protein [Myxococcales bacterium]MCB9544800.1 hypothetical protein [Myxococcales bacterium]
MKRRLLTPGFILVHLLALHALVIWFSGPGRAMAPMTEPEVPQVDAPEPDELPDEAEELAGPVAGADPLAAGEGAGADPTRLPGALDLANIYEDAGHMRAGLGHGWTAELTTDVALQKAATAALNRAKVPFGAVVVIDVKTGAILALADRYDEKHEVAPPLSRDGPPHLALRAIAPAASVFKIVTATGLLDRGVSAGAELPYHPAVRKILPQHLEEPGKGAPRADMADALAHSNNGYFARMADQKLSREDMDTLVRRFGFNQVVPFPLLTEASTAKVPRNGLERARMAAGFWHTRLTPLHGALIGAAVAGDGTLPTPRLIAALVAPDGRRVEAPQRPPFAEAMTPKTAANLRTMMEATVRSGTARRAFAKWPESIRHIKVGGKTGTLALREPYTFYTWFVGYAPVKDPEIAIAVMVGNGRLWWQRGTDVAADVMASYFKARVDAAKGGKGR